MSFKTQKKKQKIGDEMDKDFFDFVLGNETEKELVVQ
jgi:hypothetical protein